MITASQIKAIAGKGARSDLVSAIVRGWPYAVNKGKIKTSRRAAHFLAQICTETGGLSILSESGAYRYETILKIFGARQYSVPLGGRGHSAGITPAEAKRIAALPVAQRGPVLFDRVYGIGNPKKAKEFGHTKPGQGWIYRGGGMMQTTGLSGYRKRAEETGMPLVEHPEMLHQPDAAFKTAVLTWAQDDRCNKAADRNDLEAVRKIINGGTNGLEHARVFLKKALDVLRNYKVDDEEVAEEVAEDNIPKPIDEEEDPPPNVQPADISVRGDPILLDVQERLKSRRYRPGLLDGKWGGNTSGAISGFMNDRGHRLDPMPLSLDEFHEVSDDILEELLEAENEVQSDGSIGWYRPVSAARANAEPKVVTELAPETVPQKRNLFTLVGTFITTTAAAVWSTVSDYFMTIYNFFTDHEDVIDNNPEIKSAAFGWLTSIPTPIWLLAAMCLIGFIAYNTWRANKISTSAVQNGERA